MAYWSMTFPGLPEQLSEVRQFTLKVLGDDPGVDDVLLVTSERATNAIRHSFSGEPGGVVHAASGDIRRPLARPRR